MNIQTGIALYLVYKLIVLWIIFTLMWDSAPKTF